MTHKQCYRDAAARLHAAALAALPSDVAAPAGPVRGHGMSAPYALVSMFATCGLPGCGSPVIEWGQVCGECIAACRAYLQPARPDQPPITEDILADRDAAVAAAIRMQHYAAIAGETSAQGTPLASKDTQLRKQNQRCWLCEQRRTCTHPRRGWECNRCRTIT